MLKISFPSASGCSTPRESKRRIALWPLLALVCACSFGPATSWAAKVPAHWNVFTQEPCSLFLLEHSVKEGLALPQKSDLEAQVAKVYEMEEYSEAQKAQFGFYYYLKYRLQSLPKETRTEVLQALRWATVKNAKDIRGVVTAHENTLSFALELPKKLQDSEVFYFVVAHEMEHIIQELLQSRKAETNETFEREYKEEIPRLRHFDSRMFVAELGAMIAEYNYISTLPEAIRLRLRQQLEKIAAKSFRVGISLVYYAFASEAESTPHYIDEQHALGRYSQAKTIEIQFLELGKLLQKGEVTMDDISDFYLEKLALFRKLTKQTP